MIVTCGCSDDIKNGIELCRTRGMFVNKVTAQCFFKHKIVNIIIV